MYRIILLAVGMVASIFLLSRSHAVGNELDDAVQNVSDELLTISPTVPGGDEGFVRVLQAAMEAAKRERGSDDARTQNKIAILALASLLGDDRMSRRAKRERDPSLQRKKETLRNRITLRGRNDLSKHFWVSAGLVAISNETNAKAIGIAKEVMDSRPGGSGFSFADIAADLAGIRFALLATTEDVQAKEIQDRILRARHSNDFCPSIEGLPEGISAEELQNEFGGMGGEKTRELFRQINERVRASPGLRGED